MKKYLAALMLFIVPCVYGEDEYGEDEYGGYLYPTVAEADPCNCQVTGVCTCGKCECDKPDELISLVSHIKTPDSLGFGAPKTKAPLVETLVALRQDSGYYLIDQHHAPPAAAQSLAVPTSPSAPLQNYRREYAGMSCENGVCQATYRWVPVSYQTAAPVAYDSIGGGVAIQGSGNAYGCAGTSYGCAGAQAGCSGSASAGCSGASRGLFRGRRGAILPWRRR